MTRSPFLLLLGVQLLSSPAVALPRFSARNSNECIQCHVNPTGGGMRNAYGRNVFEKVWLPLSARAETDSWLAPEGPPAEAETADGVEGGEHLDDGETATKTPAISSFSGDINEWLAIGADFRAAYIYIRPDDPLVPGQDRATTSSFFLMQADLYHAATLHDRVTLVLDVGVYSGFEAWGLIRFSPNFLLKVGRFLPPFGVREVEHQLFTRGGIGLGATDRDTGAELTTFLGPFTANIALLNGTLADTALDTHGSERRTFEKAAAGRFSYRWELGPFRSQLGTSAYFSQNVSQANPLLAAGVPTDLAADAGEGLDELRLGGFLTANLGRFTYIGDFALIRNDFYADTLPELMGYASYQELSFLPIQGVDLIATFEFKEPDLEIAGDSTSRAGFVVELFPWPFTEFRAMVRRTSSDSSPTGGAWDVVLFTHLFL